MRAVNLIPVEERRSRGMTLSRLSPQTVALLGVLLAALIVVTALVLLGNATNDRRDEASRVQAETAAVQREVDQLTDRPALDARERSVSAVRSLVGTRYDWSRLLGSVSYRLPRNVAITSFNGTVGPAAATAPGTAPTSGAADASAAGVGASVALTGCAASLHAIARLMERMRQIRGVLDVTFTSSSKSSGSGSSSGNCPHPRSFQVDIGLEGPSLGSTGATS